MGTGVEKARATLLIVAAALGVAAVAFSLEANAKRRALRMHRNAFDSLAPDMALLDRYAREASALEADGPPPENLPLPVSLPAPSKMTRNTTATRSGEWETTSFRLRWEGQPRTALEALAAICNLPRGWRIAEFSLTAGKDGIATLDAMVETVRRSNGVAQ